MTKRKQGFLVGMEPPHIEEVDEAARDLYSVRKRRMEMAGEEIELTDRLLGLMKKHELKTYNYEGLTVSINTLEKVEVKRKKEPKEDGDDA